MPSTVIMGPPERIRTRSPGRNGALVGLGIADGADPEKAGTDKGMLSTIPSATVAAIDIRFVKVDMLNSISDKNGHGVAFNRRN
jgi:hypothetical protein